MCNGGREQRESEQEGKAHDDREDSLRPVTRTLLWHLELSHYSEKARWALDFKRVPHARRGPIPGFHVPIARALTGQPRMPILELGGRRIPDSTRIIAALEEHAPDPPLYPADPAERERALALEDYFDEKVARAVRGFAFHYALDEPAFMVDAVMPSAGPGRKTVMRGLYAAAAPWVRKDYRTSPDGDAIRAGMDRLEAGLGGRDHLVGDRFTVADLTAAAVFTPVIAPPQRPHLPDRLPPEVLALREELTARPGGQWVHETYARHR